MSLPRFDFAPREWPPFGVGAREGLADAVFDVVWDGKRVEVLARRVDVKRAPGINGQRQLFFKRRDDKHVRVVSLPHKLPQIFGELEKRDDETLIRWAVRTGMWGYAFHLDTTPWNVPGTAWLYLDADKETGCWTAFNTVFRPTHFQVKPDFSHLVAALEDGHSDARFALRWSQLSREEQQRRCFCFPKGDFDELYALVRALCLVQPFEEHCLSFDKGGFSIQRKWYWDVTSDARLRRWALHTNRYFAPFVNPVLAPHQCVRLTFPQVQTEWLSSPPTQHERLEAALFLRDWAQGKIPPDELRLLLPKL